MNKNTSFLSKNVSRNDSGGHKPYHIMDFVPAPWEKPRSVIQEAFFSTNIVKTAALRSDMFLVNIINLNVTLKWVFKKKALNLGLEWFLSRREATGIAAQFSFRSFRAKADPYF